MEAGCRPLQVHTLISDRRHDICVRITFFLLRSTFAVAEQKNDPSDQENTRGYPADEESFSQFTLLRIHHQRVVEVPDDGVANPADGYERDQKGNQKQNPAWGQSDVLAPSIVPAAVAPFHPAYGYY